MRVVHILPSLTSREGGGGPVVSTVALARGISDAGWETEIWATGYDLAHRVISADKGNPTTLVFPHYGHRWFYSPALGRHIQENLASFDIVNAHELWTYGALMAMRQAQPGLGRALCLLHVHGALHPWALHHHGYRKRLYSLILHPLVNKVDAVRVLNRREEDSARQWRLDVPFWVIPNFVEPLPVEAGSFRKAHSIPPGVPLITVVSRFHPVKRLVDLCEVFELVQRDLGDVHFAFAGDYGCSYGKTVLKAVQRRALRNVLMLGHCGGRQKWELLADSTVFCQFSIQEGHSAAITEALAAGCPVAISTGCNFDEVSEYGAGLVVDTVPAMAQGVVKILRDGQLRLQMSSNARRLVSERFTKERVVRQYMTLAEEAVRNLRATRGWGRLPTPPTSIAPQEGRPVHTNHPHSAPPSSHRMSSLRLSALGARGD